MPEGQKKIRVSNLKTNMVLARDVVSDAGIILMTENTMLNDRNIMKLKVYDIEAVYVNETLEQNEEIYSEPINVKEGPERSPLTDTPEFKDFVTHYDKQEEVAKESLLSIGSGHGVDLSQLYTISNDIMKSLRNKSDLFTYLGNLKTKDDHTYSHCVNVSLLCNLFGFWLGFKSEEIINITTAGMLHDIGKTAIDDKILNKPGKLTDAEFLEIKKHTTYGYRMLENKDIPEEIKLSALMHHERLNGAGYPTGAKESQINNYAKIVAIADIYEAMTTNRVYRDKICPFNVIKTFEQNSFGELDTQYLLIFLQNIAYTYVGSWVKLSDGREGEVVFINANHLSMPIVRVGKDFVDLSLAKNIIIETLL